MPTKIGNLWLLVVSLIILSSGCQSVGPAGCTLERTQHLGTLTLRGFGRVAADGSLWRTAAGEVSQVRFTCADAAAARIVGSKYLADLLAYGAVSQAPDLEETGGTALTVRHGGEWLLALDGYVVQVVTAPTREALTTLASGLGATNWQSVPAHAYPRYLDNFDNAGLGIWWMPTTKTPEQIAWMEAEPAAVNLHEQSLAMSPAAGVVDLSATANALAQVQAMEKPYRHMLWSGEPPWFNALQRPGQNLVEFPPGYIGRRFFAASGYYDEQVASPAVNTVQESILIEMMRCRVNDPNLLAWMEPHGEFFQSDPARVPPGYQQRFPAYLQLVKHYSLASISAAYTGDQHTYATWDAVPYPSTAWFAGRRDQFTDLDDVPWHWRPGPLAAGETQGWNQIEFADAAWNANYRDSKIMLSQWDNSRVDPLWLRFDHVVTPAFLAATKGQPLYLHVLPYTERAGGPLTIWVNGQAVARQLQGDPTDYINRHTQVAVTTVLRPGVNHFVIYSNGGRIAYRVFLSDVPGEAFPFADVQLNQRYLDWRDYLTWEKFQTLRAYLRVMRSVDPNRPIKVMTPFLFQAQALELFTHYGAYPQLTGEGGWYRPMHYKGYARLYGLPGSSEPGGPMSTARQTQNMFANIFWESQDCHDYVFDLARDLWPHPEVVQWWTDHKALLHTLGKVDFGPARVGVLRDVGQDMRYANHQIWNWDISRGPLPALGLTPVLIDGLAMEAGRTATVPVIFDDATIVMEPALVAAIHRYVDNGGIFIAQHHTGENTPLHRDGWPLAHSFGLTVAPRPLPQENSNKGPRAPLHFTQDQTLFPSLRGKTCDGGGVAIDATDHQYTGAIAIQGTDANVTPIATWADGRMAVTEVREGRGRFILIGTPFFLRFKDENGRWFNDDQRQKLLADLLAGVGVQRDTRTSDPRIWLERRESKNGLYDVYLAGALGIPDKTWQLGDRITANLAVERPAMTPAIAAASAGAPEVTTSWRDGWLSFGQQAFEPFQIHQFAVVRADVGLTGPFHWLQVQARTWRALDVVPPALAETVTAAAAQIAAENGEAGLDLSQDWRVRVDPTNPESTSWLTAPTTDNDWRDGAMGSWLVNGWPAATCVQYRKHFVLPATWRQPGHRVILGLAGWWSFGIRDRGTLWLNGKPLAENLHGLFAYDITDAAGTGALDVALQVEGKALERGPVGTLYLRRTPAPIATIPLDGAWTQIVGWGEDQGVVELPLSVKKLFGLRRQIDIPQEWAGHPVRLVVEPAPGGAAQQIDGCIINRTGFFRAEDWAPLGPRVDRWLVPGQTNVIELYGRGFMSTGYTGFDARIQRITLQVYPVPTAKLK